MPFCRLCLTFSLFCAIIVGIRSGVNRGHCKDINVVFRNGGIGMECIFSNEVNTQLERINQRKIKS